MADDRRIGDFGQSFTIGVNGVDPTTFNSVILKVRKPSGAHVQWTPSSMTSSVVTYTFVEGDLDETGVYFGQLLFFTSSIEQATSTEFSLSVGNVV